MKFSSDVPSVQILNEDIHSLEAALRQDERTAILIDGANCFSTIKALDFQMDWKKLRELLLELTNVAALNYYSAITQEDDGTIRIKKLLDFIEYNGFTMVTKDAKRIRTSDDTVRIKGNMDVEIVVDAMQLAPYIDHLILFTGDGDFRTLLKYYQKHGKKASVLSSSQAGSASAADELRRTATYFIELSSFKNKVMLEKLSEE